MTTTTKNKHAFKVTVVLLALLIAGVYSCNSGASDKAATDSTAKMSTDTSVMKPADTATKMAVDTAKVDTSRKDTKAPPPPPPKP